jgi:hypothetical protein
MRGPAIGGQRSGGYPGRIAISFLIRDGVTILRDRRCWTRAISNLPNDGLSLPMPNLARTFEGIAGLGRSINQNAQVMIL